MIKTIRVIAGIALAAGLSAGLTPAAYAHDTPREAANKKLVLAYHEALEKPGQVQRISAIAKRFIAPDYIQHDAKNGRQAFIQSFQGPRPGWDKMAPAKLVTVMAEGDKVILITSRDVTDPATGATKPAIIWNMFRIKHGKFAEHWDAVPTSIRPASVGQ